MIGVTLFRRLYPSKSGEGPTSLEGPTSRPTVKITKGTEIGCYDFRNRCASQISLTKDVYEVRMLGKKGFLMLEEDFDTLFLICHDGAFGNDFRKLTQKDLKGNSELIKKSGFETDGTESLYFLWKIPADLKKIGNYVPNQDEIYTEENVGAYVLLSDGISTETSPTANHALLTEVQSKKLAKIRVDFSDGTQSVHFLASSDKTELIPGISTEFFFTNFYNPQAPEQGKLQQFMESIKSLGFGAYLCNEEQHQVIIAAYNEVKLDPKSLAALFSENEPIKNQFIDALKTAATESNYQGESMVPKVDKWMENFLRRFL